VDRSAKSSHKPEFRQNLQRSGVVSGKSSHSLFIEPNLSVSSATNLDALTLILGFALPITPALAQVAAGVLKTAQDSCVTNAKSKGFQLRDVVGSGASDRPEKDAKVVLNLTKDGNCSNKLATTVKPQG